MARTDKRPAFDIVVSDHLAAIELCLRNKHWMPALILIYCGIDTLANVGRSASKAEATRSDFIEWSEKYMECATRLDLTGTDLYGARCGVVHAYSSESSLSAKGRARPIIYAWGKVDIDGPNAFIRSTGRNEFIVKIEVIYDAFKHGIETFSSAVKRDVAFAALVESRSQKLIVGQPTFP